MTAFKIATYNVNSLRSRLHIVLPWLERNRPDVLCLQETKVADPEFPFSPFREAGYHVVFSGGKQYNGVAVISRREPEDVLQGLDDDGPTDRDRLIAVRCDGITVINTYVPQGRDRDDPQFQYKLTWFRRFRRFLERRYGPQDRLIWCGDLNVAPEAIDVHHPRRLLGHVCFTSEVWEGFSHVKAWGLTDAFRRLHPDETDHYTFFDYRVPHSVNRKLGWRIDHILLTDPLLTALSTCAIDMNPRLSEKPSDHTILVAELAW